MSFGFSIGDVLVCSQVAYRTYNALKSAPAEFQELRLEVLSLNTTLQALADESSSPTSIILLAPPQRQESLRILLENCTKGLKQLDVLVGKYPSLGLNERTRFLEHIRFASKGKQGPRDKLAIHTASINIFLTSLTHSSLGRLELLIKNALRGGEKGALSTLNATQESNAWNSIGQDLALEGIGFDIAAKFKHEIEAYTRHLANGGDPFWMKARQGPPRPQGAPPRYEAQQPMQSPPSSSGGMLGSTLLLKTQQNQGSSFDQAPEAAFHNAQPSQSHPQQQAAPGAVENPVTPQQELQSTSGSSCGQPVSSSFGRLLFGSSPSTEFSNTSGSALNQSNSGSNQQPQNGGTQPATGPSSTAGRQFGSGFGRFGPQKPEQKPGGLLGSTAPETSGGLLGKPAATGSLFGGGTTGTNGGLFDSSQPAQNRTSSGLGFGGRQVTAPGSSVFGGQQPTIPGGAVSGKQPPGSSGSLFGGLGSYEPGGGPSGQNSSSLFGAPQVNTQEVEELAELFDHIFDMDEEVVAIAQGATRTPYPVDPPTPAPISELRHISSVRSLSVYSPPPGPTAAQNVHQWPQETRSRYDGRVKPSIVTDADVAITNNLLHTVRIQLEQVVIQYRDAQRAGDSRRVAHLLHNAIQNRVQYLRNAGLVLIQCDLCHAPITDGYYHCDICADSDWDCCPQCLEQGKGCLGGHGLGRRNKDWIGEKHWMKC